MPVPRRRRSARQRSSRRAGRRATGAGRRRGRPGRPGRRARAPAPRGRSTSVRSCPKRRLSSSSPPSQMRRPWSMISRREQSRSMSARSWVVSSTVTPRSRLTSDRNSRTAALATTSRPIVGSSRKTISGSCRSAAVSSPRIRWPSESWRTGVAMNGCETERLGEAVEVLAMPPLGDAVDVAQELEGVGQRQVPPELRALAEDDPDAARELDPLPRRIEARDPETACGGHEDPGEHLDGGRLSCAVRPDVADHRAALDRERDPVDGQHLSPHASQPAGLGPHDEALLDVLQLDHPPALR